MPPDAPTPGLTGAEKTRLRGLGQRLADTVFVGRDGLTPAIAAELDRQLGERELVKARFTAAPDRRERARLAASAADASRSTCLGTVGHTALFWRPPAAGSRLLSR